MKYIKLFENNNNRSKNERFARELMALSDIVVSDIDKLLKDVNTDYVWGFKGFTPIPIDYEDVEIDLTDSIIEITNELDKIDITLSDVRLLYSLSIKKTILNQSNDFEHNNTFNRYEIVSVGEWVNQNHSNDNLLKEVVDILTDRYDINHIYYNNISISDSDRMLIIIGYDLKGLSNSVNNATFKMNG